jgi:exonuclease SbcC
VRITRVYLRNYRVYEDPLELEIPPGLVGIYGVNGAGKSVLLEAILFTLWGVARTSRDEVRTAGIVADCVTEVSFEHEGHLYLVRRTLSGASATSRAEAHADGSQVAEGVTDTGRYVHSLLGMDSASFRASVFAEQKQLAAFSVRRPGERRALVLSLLGITPLDVALRQARSDSRDALSQLAQVRAVLTDPAQIEAELELERVAAAAASAEAQVASAVAEASATVAASAEAEHRRLDQLGRMFEALMAEGKARRAEHDDLVHRAQRLEGEAEELAEAGGQLEGLEESASGLASSQALLGLVEVVAGALSGYRLSEAQVPAEPVQTDADGVALAVEVAGRARSRFAELEGRRLSALEDLERAALASSRAAELSGEEQCPLCGQELGEAAEAVQAHRRDELAAAEARATAVQAAVAEAAAEAARTDRLARAAQAELVVAELAWADWRRAKQRQAEAQTTLEEAIEAALAAGVRGVLAPDGAGGAGGAAADAPGRAPALLEVAEAIVGRRVQLAAEVELARQAAEEAANLRGRLLRGPAVAVELVEIGDRIVALETELAELREKLKALDFRQEDLSGATRSADEARSAAQEAAQASHAAQLALATAQAGVASVSRRLEDSREQHRRLAEMGEQARHLGRAAELLGTFRNVVVGSVGPRLSAQANELFAELTDNEYDGLEVDPETYEIQIRDQGSVYGMDRFSGSETDLANLALRVAISEQVMLLSGGSVGLLVLDEVFGPLDADRKERMLLALERLKGRFGQVLVVTHDNELKEQLPNAIEVVKLPGRRATARVL